MKEPDGAKIIKPGRRDRHKMAGDIVAQAFSEAGWKVIARESAFGPKIDLLVEGPNISYTVEVKAVSEGRGDRLIPVWSQAYVQARHYAQDRYRPLAVVAVPRIGQRDADKLIDFAREYAPDAGLGIIDFDGLRIFRGAGLESLNSEIKPKPELYINAGPKHPNLFSDLNQWMLKVLLAPQIPENLLSAPRLKFKNASQLAEAAQVSVMTAFRFVEQLKEAGYLHESDRFLSLVRLADLFQRWQSAALSPIREIPIKFILRGDPEKELNQILDKGVGCLGLFAAADALQLGFVKGVPPYVYLPKLDDESVSELRNLRVAHKNEPPDLFLRQPKAVQSVFRGMVCVNDVWVSDVIQIWLDVSHHPARGAEQSTFLRDQIIGPILRGDLVHG